jgi:UDP-N-acetylmuramate dehydrogenase
VNKGVVERIRGLFRGELRQDELLQRHTSLKVGGPADLFAVPQDVDDLQVLVAGLDAGMIPWFVIGGGFNLLVRDGGFRGAAISLKKLDRIELRPAGLYAMAGANNRDLVNFARDRELSGLEFLAGIPGTLGGALRMNAGAHGSEIFDRVARVEMLCSGQLRNFDKKALEYGYRRLQLEHNKIIIAAGFQFVPGSREMISATIDDCLKKRLENQQVGFPTAGSFFKNPPGLAAWRLIDETGLRGFCVGGAQVSEIHCNFLVNRGGATADDFQQLAAIIRDRVFDRSGVRLEEEVRIIGEENR